MSRRIGGAVAAIAVALAILASCSSGSSSSSDTTAAATTAASATATEVRPAGPAADLSQELTGGNGVFLGSAISFVPPEGWEEHEYVADGTATAYTAPGPIPTDGRVELTEGRTADYRTRVVVRRPSDPADFNGTVVVEWLNVSGGVDAAPDFTYLAPEIERTGTVWVGVSAQLIGVEGGDVAVDAGSGNDAVGKGIVNIDPARYGSLDHPGDDFSYDIYTQVARALRGSGAETALDGLQPERVLAIGESQSAFALTTYANGVQPLTEAYDGFLIHSRGGAPLSVSSPSGAADIAGSITNPPVTIRTDLDVPVLTIETETDVTSVIGYYPARQDDTDRFRLWEVAGTAHADRSQMGSFADSVPCGAEVNDGPQRFAIRSGLRALDSWVRTGQPPAAAPRLEVTTTSGSPVIVRDADGIALGGIRFPQVTVPVATLSGEKGPTGGVICMLLGTTVPFTAERLAQLYPSADAYLTAYTAATDQAIADGWALQGDRGDILADADPAAISG
jgi:hypothetical protein